jgi:amino acid adenylation domain-containing protein
MNRPSSDDSLPYHLDLRDDRFTHRVYWNRTLAAPLPDLGVLPHYAESETTPEEERSLESVERTVSPERLGALRETGGDAPLAQFVVAYACVNLALRTYLRSDDIIVATPTYEAPSLLHDVYLRTRLHDAQTFREVLDCAHQTVVEAYAHQYYPPVELAGVHAPDVQIALASDRIHHPLRVAQLRGDADAATRAALLQEADGDSARDVAAAPTIDAIAGNGKGSNGAGGDGSGGDGARGAGRLPPVPPMAIVLSLGGDSPHVLVRYDRDLYRPSAMEQLAGHLVHHLCERPSDDLDQPLAATSLVDADTRELLLRDFNGVEGDYPNDQPVHVLFENTVAEVPDRVVIEHESQKVTYAAINRRANRMAHYLRGHDVGPGDLVGILLPRGVDVLVAILAILKAGAAFVPFDLRNPEARIQYMVEDSRIRTAVTTVTMLEGDALYSDEAVLDLVLCIDAPSPDGRQRAERHGVRVAQSDAWDDRPADNLASVTDRRDLAFVMYTSGSTGQPKGAMLRHDGTVNHVFAEVELMDLSAQTTFLQSAPTSSDISIWQFVGPALFGGRTVVANMDVVTDAPRLWQLMRDAQITLVEFVPIVLRSLLKEAHRRAPDHALPALETAMVVGEAAPVPLVNRWLETYPDVTLVDAYGPSEASDDVTQTALRPMPPDQRSVPIGRPVPNGTIYVLDDHLRLVPPGVAGEICVSGVGVGAGYWGKPRRTATSFVPNPYPGEGRGDLLYRTGDLGRWDEDGMLEFLGRIDFQIQLRGHRVEPGEVEAALQALPSVDESVVVARRDPQDRKRLVAYVVPTRQAAFDADQLRSSLEDELPHYMVPSKFVALTSLTLTPNRKVDRNALPDPEWGRPDASDSFVAPRTSTETTLARLWQKVLDVDSVGAHDNFFGRGGHSLLATQLTSRIQSEFGVDLPLRRVFESPTLAELAQVIDRSDPTKEETSLSIPPTDRDASQPLAHTQERVWFIHTLERSPARYNVHVTIEASGPFDLQAMRRSLRTLVERHAVFRTAFEQDETGSPVQRIQPFEGLDVPTVDVSSLDSSDRGVEQARAYSGKQGSRPFDLTEGHLVRASIYRIGDQQHWIAFTTHHLVWDGWSEAILKRELGTLYDAFKDGRASPLSPLPIQYVDYAAWQRRRLDDGTLDDQVEYWKDQLEGIPALEFPAADPRPEVPNHAGRQSTFHLPESLVDRLRDVANEEEATLFMTLMAALQVVLARFSGQEDFGVGLPIANRPHEELESIVGFFASTLVLRADFSSTPSFRDVLRRVRAAALDAYEHQDVPFEKIVAELSPSRDIGRNPLFQVLFSLENTPQQSVDTGELHLARVPTGREYTLFDLSINCVETERGIEGSYLHSTELFAPAFVDELMTQFEHVLRRMAAELDQPALHVQLLTGDHSESRLPRTQSQSRPPARRTRGDGSPTAASHRSASSDRSCVTDRFAGQARDQPDASALVDGHRTVTYGHLDGASNRLARALRRREIQAGDRVGICVEPSVEMVAAVLAVLKAGAAYVPVTTTYPDARIQFVFDDAGVDHVITTSDLTSRLDGDDRRLFVLDREPWSDLSDAPLDDSPSLNDVAYVRYTSGSTGRPKGVIVTHQNVARLFPAFQEALDFSREDVWTLFHSVAFDVSVWEMWGALRHGGTLVVVPPNVRRDPIAFADFLEDRQVTFLSQTPSAFSGIVRMETVREMRDFASLRAIVFAGERLSMQMLKPWIQRHGLSSPALINAYGATEGTVHDTVHRLDEEDFHDPTRSRVGQALSDLSIRLLDDRMQPLPPGVPGEIYLSGAGVALGYENRPAETAAQFLPNPFDDDPGSRLYRTGDRGYRLPDGTLVYLGRSDDQVKIRGYRVELGEVETTLHAHDEVQNVVVLSREDATYGQHLVAYVVSEQKDLRPDDLRRFARRTLPEYMVPQVFVRIDALPLTPNGKVDTEELPDPDPDPDASADRSIVPPRTDVENRLLAIFRDVLPADHVGVTDDFFDAGGHSLLAVHLLARIEEAFGQQVPMMALFSNGSVEQLARLLQVGRAEEKKGGPLVQIRSGEGTVPLVLAHPIGGGVMVYYDLVRDLSPEWPVYGLRSPGRYGGDFPGSIREMAQSYVAALEPVVHPPDGCGQVVLGGYSMGGIVAAEMARVLADADVDVLDLILFDTHLPADEAAFDASQTLAFWARRAGVVVEEDALRGFDAEAQIEYVLQRGRNTGTLPESIDAERVRTLWEDRKNNERILEGYEPAPLDQHVTFLRATQRAETDGATGDATNDATAARAVDPTERWKNYLQSSMTVVDVEGTHESFMTPPGVNETTRVLQRILDEMTGD